MRRLFALAFVGVALVAGCGGDDESSGSELEGLTVFAAASLTESFQELAPDARFNFAGSDELATQIREGAPADVYAAASPRYPDELFEEDLIEEPQIFATNRLVLVVPADNPAGIESVEDLGEEGTKLVVGAEGVPVGDYTRTVLENMGADRRPRQRRLQRGRRQGRGRKGGVRRSRRRLRLHHRLQRSAG